MEKRKLGQSSIEVSLLGLGGNNFGGRLDLAATRAVVHKALDLGVTLIDTAESYNAGRSEELLADVLAGRRNEVVLASKFGLATAGGSRDYIMRAAEASLKRLRTDWIDLYQLHRPDPATPIEETLRALNELVRQGKVRHIGCSNLSGPQVVEAQQTAKRHGLPAFVTAQDQYSLLARGIERELIPALTAQELSLIPYYPLASGLLSGKHKRDVPLAADSRMSDQRYADRFVSDRNWRLVEGLDTLARAHGRSMLELAFGWLAAKPVVASIIAGASTPAQVEQNVRAAACKLSAAEVAEADRITQ